MKKWFVLFVAMAYLMTTTACSGTSSVSESASSANSTVSATSENSSQNKKKTLENPKISIPFPDKPFASYPVKKGGKVTVWMKFNTTTAKYYRNLSEHPVFKQIMQKTGIDIEFIHPPAGQESENFNLLVTSGSIPDISCEVTDYYPGGATKAVNDGVFADLTDLMPEYAPDYMYFMEKNGLFKKLATTNDGKIYCFYNYKDAQAPFYTHPQFRKDWLDEWNMKTPLTLDEYEAYFKKVKEEKAVSPFILAPDGLELELLGAFDIASISQGGNHLFLKDGKIHQTFYEPAFKDYLAKMNDWYKKGYISKDFTSVEDVSKDFATEKTGCVFGNDDVVYSMSKESGMKVINGSYPRLKGGQQYHGDIVYFPQNGGDTYISAKSPNKELAIQLLNYCYTKEGASIRNFGEEGTVWNWGADGKPKYTDYALDNTKYPASDLDNVIRLHSPFLPAYRCGDDVGMIRNVKDPESWNYRASYQNDKTVDGAYAVPPLQLTKGEADEVGKTMGDVSTYANEMILKLITGTESIDKFDEFSQNLKDLGIERAIEIYQGAYDRLVEKK